MHELKITGETPEALYLNAVNMLAIFLRGATTPVPSAQVVGEAPSEAAVSRTSDAVQPEPEVIPPAPKARKGKKDTEPKVLNDEMPDLGAKALTLDGDIRPRLRAIQQACTKRNMDMAETIAYIQKLYGPFGIAKAEQLKPEQFAEFMDLSDAYLSGEA